ncbi:uncharacterized protein A4U43_C02F10890 [Asparagus officinalis]|uniref:Phytocyanin domain-containing protein n=1 Tax=Asparagus officinalis TaxID=4686 RepID=A0A5P1FHK9_ASPOF|nr:uncharacterized protein A4U43_C02F10890 [Asparagus officinalis]
MLTALLPPAASAPAAPLPPYTNHTVGGTAGWFFDVKKNSSSADYSKWARSQSSFYLGDFLIFKTNSNMSVVQTTNKTTYNRCDASEDDGALIYTIPGVDNEKFGVSASSRPLTRRGGQLLPLATPTTGSSASRA